MAAVSVPQNPQSLAEPLPGAANAMPEGVAPLVAPSASTDRGRYEFLDAVRGLAALLVALQHGIEAFNPPTAGAEHLLNLGEIGVVAFFLVSGFIIPRSLESHNSLRLFWLGRAFRLYPAYWLSLLGAFFAMASGHMASPFAGMPSQALGFLANATMLQRVFAVPNAIGVYWTLALELVFYLLSSVLFVAGLLRRSAACLWSALLLYLFLVLTAASVHRSLPAGWLGLLVSAFVGTLAMRSLSDPRARRSLLRATLPTAAFLTLGLYLRFGRFPVPHETVASSWQTVVLSWALGYALFFALFALRRRRFPRPLLWLGRISYSFYLWHVLVFVSMPRLGSPWLTLALDLLVTAGIATLSFHWIERPSLSLQRRLFPAR